LEYASYTKGLDKSSQESLRFAQGVQKSFDQASSASREYFTGMVKGAAAAAAALLSVRAVVDGLKSAIDAADHLNDLSKKTGIAVDTLGGLGFAAGQAGMDLDSVSAGAGKLNKAIADAATGNKEAAEAFQVLGISLKDTSGQLKKADEVIAEVADKFAQYEDGPEKAAIALRLFGKAGADMIPLLNDGGDALKENIAYYKQFAGVTEDVASKADAYNDALGKLHLLNGAFSRTLAAEMLPNMQTLVDYLLKGKENSDLFKTAANGVATLFETMVIVGANVVYVFKGIGNEIGGIAAQLAALATGDFKAFSAIGEAMKRDAEAARKELDGFEKRIMSRQQGGSETFESGFVGTGALQGTKGRAPALPNKGDTDKKELEGQLKAIQNAYQAERDATAFNLALIGELRAQDLVDVNAYEQAKIAAIQHGLESAKKAFDAEIAALQDYKAKAGKPEDRADADNKIADAKAKRAKAERDAANATTLALVQQDRAQSDLNRGLKDWIALHGYAAENAALEIDLMGRSAQEIEKITNARRIQLDVEERIRQAQKLSSKPIDRTEYDKAAANAIATANMLIDAKYQKSRDPWFNLTESVRAYGEEAANVGKQIGDAMTDGIKSAEDAWVSYVTTGKLSFDSLARSVIANLARMQAQQGIAFLTGGSGGGASFLSAIGSLFGAAGGASGAPVNMGGGSGLTLGGGSGLGSMGGGTGLQFRAEGGPVSPGSPFIVGERGPELFIPQSFGAIAPNKSLPAAMSQPAQKSITLSPVYNVTVHSDVDKASSERMMRNVVAEGNAKLVEDMSRAGLLG
jgi:lambda family phage tail tape measure protein